MAAVRYCAVACLVPMCRAALRLTAIAALRCTASSHYDFTCWPFAARPDNPAAPFPFPFQLHALPLPDPSRPRPSNSCPNPTQPSTHADGYWIEILNAENSRQFIGWGANQQ